MPPIYNSYTEITTGTLKNCTGTLNMFFSMSVTQDKKMLFIFGRARITNFVRTSSNPGINFTLPFTPIRTTGPNTGYRAENPAEFAHLNISANSTVASLETTESYSNAASGTLTLVIPFNILKIA